MDSTKPSPANRQATLSFASSGDESPATPALTSSKSFKIDSTPAARKSINFGDESPGQNSNTSATPGNKSVSSKSPGLTSAKSFRGTDDLGSSTGGLQRSKSFSAPKGTNIVVAVRCRPLNAEEKKSGEPSVVTCDSENNSVKVIYGPSTSKKPPKHLVYDKVFGAYSKQSEIFETVVQPIADEALIGFNCTVFAYGPTGTGKTHTMEGDIDSPEEMGLIPRCGKYLLEALQKNHPDFSLKVSFLEIYNEELSDLLSMTNDKRLKLCEDLKRGVICQHLEEFPIFHKRDMETLLRRGISNRQTQSTAANLNSSRSHGIFTFRLSIKETDSYGEEIVKTGQLNLVDLAGSECIGRSGAKNERAREAGSINQSLLTLGRVITSLVDHHSHIPYRDSKLTRLLQESLGGKTKTCIIATLSPSLLTLEDSISTLDYAYRAKMVKNQPVVNVAAQQKIVMKEYFAEIETLKSLLHLAREKNGVYLDPVEFTNMEARLATQDGQLQELEICLRSRDEEIKNLNKDREDLEQRNADLKSELETTESNLEDMTNNFNTTKKELHDTLIELRATESVVEAQVETENSLTAQGMELLKDLSARQNDVDNLLGKVDRLAGKETERVNLTSTFVTSATANSSELIHAVSVLSQQSSEHATKLGQSVEHILISGQEICDELKNAIGTALSELQQDAKVSRDSVSSSCSELNTHLKSSSTNVENALLKVQRLLASWLKETQSSANEALKHNTAVQTLLTESSKNIASHCSRMREASEAFATKQEAAKVQLLQQAAQLKSDLKAKLEQYRAASETRGQEADALLRTKLGNLEQVVTSMLKEIVSSHSVATEKNQEKVREFSSEMEGLTGASADRVGESVSAMQKASADHSVAIAGLLESTSTSYAAHNTSATQSLTASSTILNAVAQSSEVKNTELDASVAAVIADISSAVSGSLALSKKTSDAGDKFLSNTAASAARMSESTSGSVTAFTGCLQKETDSLLAELKKHFSVVKDHLASQQEGLHGIKNKVTTLGEKVAETVLKPSGDTPKKTHYRKRAPLAATRDHGAIKKELRDALLSKLQEHLSHQNNGAQQNGEVTTTTGSAYSTAEAAANLRLSDMSPVAFSNGNSPPVVKVAPFEALRSTPSPAVLVLESPKNAEKGDSSEKKHRRSQSFSKKGSFKN